MSVFLLSEADRAEIAVDADVCVVGAGIAGLVLATRLARSKRRVVVVESGGRRSDPECALLNDAELAAPGYSGFRIGRTRGLGGTSSLWGGRMLPLRPSDTAARPHVGLPAWPIPAEDLAPYRPQIEHLFGLDALSFEDDFLRQLGLEDSFGAARPDFSARWPKWASFRKSNLAILLKEELEAVAGPEIWLGATVTGFEVDHAAGRVLGASAIGTNGRSLRVTANEIVLAAGTIESTRLLLWLNECTDRHAFAGCAALGRYFSDHVSTIVGRLCATDPVVTTRLFGFHFVGDTRRNLHLETVPAAQEADKVGSSFAQVVIETEPNSALDTIKNLLRGLQRRQVDLPLSKAARLVGECPDLIRMAAWRYYRRRLYLPVGTELLLSIVAEQLPHEANRIVLAAGLDRTGVPVPRIDWRVRTAEVRTFASTKSRLKTFWTRSGFDRSCPVEWHQGACDEQHLTAADGLDIFHPSGSARMGADRRTSVLDDQLRCHAIPNVSVVSAAAFPSAGSANPTYALIQLAMRTADRLAASTLARAA